MKDYHTHVPNDDGGYLCSVTRADWDKVVAARKMSPCFGVHPWHVASVDPAQIAFDLDEWLSRYPQADVGETGLDATKSYRDSLEQQKILLQVHLGAAFRHDRMAHLHGAHAWADLLSLLKERQRNHTLPRILLHAWNGSPEMARDFLCLGAIFTVGLRELSHPNAAERYARIPSDRIFPESDDHPEYFPRCVALLSLRRADPKAFQ